MDRLRLLLVELARTRDDDPSGLDALISGPGVWPAAQEAATQLARNGESDAAGRLVGALAAQDPERAAKLDVAPEVLLSAAEYRIKAGNPGLAAWLLARALERAPDTLYPRAAALLQSLGRPADAAALALTAPVRDVEAAIALAFLANRLERQGALTEAVAVQRHVLRSKLLPALHETFLGAALPAFRRSLNDGPDLSLLAEAAAVASAALERVSPLHVRELVRLAESMGRPDLLELLGASAAAALRMSGASPPPNLASAIEALVGADPEPQALIREGLALHAAGRRMRAAIAFALAHALDPSEPAARLNHAFAELAAARVAPAAEIFAACAPADEATMARVAWPVLGGRPWPFAPTPAELTDALAAMRPAGTVWPEITLVTPSLNQARWLEETILSVQGQAYPRLQYIVVDGGSSDGSAEIIQRHRNAIDTAIIEPDHGQANALNKGLALARGDLVGWINADDMLAPGALFMAAAAWLRDPAADVVHGLCLVHRERAPTALQVPLHNGAGFDTAALSDVFGRWMRGEFFLQPEALFTRRLLNGLGGRLDETLRWTFDYAFWLAAAQRGARVLSVPWPFAFYRLHSEQKTSDRRGVAFEQAAVRDRALRPSPLATRVAEIRDRLRNALATNPPRLILLDDRPGETSAPEALAEAAEALARTGIVLEAANGIGTDLAHANVVLRITRAHDGPDWVQRLRGAGFTGPVVGWLIEDLRDPYANAEIAQALDIVVPSQTGAGYLANAHALVLPLLPPAAGEISGRRAARLFGLHGAAPREAEPGPPPRPWDDGDARFVARLRRKAALLHPLPGGGLPGELFTTLLAGQVPVLPDAAQGLDEAIPRLMQATLPVLRHAPGEEDAVLRRAIQAFDDGGFAGAEARHRFALEQHSLAVRLKQLFALLRDAAAANR